MKTNIFDSERNRPADLQGPPRERTAEDEARLNEILATAISPEQVAEQVLESVRGGSFWIFTHPEFAQIVQLKMQSMLDAFPPMPEGAAAWQPPVWGALRS
ncbi:MAG: hypothetical protein U5R48_05315 [Gammaproteobacteria bacterium]|nr:hypothetical protein [Gammaproteobacteria bacterium]